MICQIQTSKRERKNTRHICWRAIIPVNGNVYVLHKIPLDVSQDVYHALHALRELPNSHGSHHWFFGIHTLFTDRILADGIIDQVSQDDTMNFIR
jgi:hypothetical protein